MVVGQSITYQEVVSQKDWDRYQEIRTELDKDWDWDKEETIKERNQLSDELVLLKRGADWIEEGYRRHLSVDIPYRSDGRLHKEDNPFYNGTLKNEKVKTHLVVK
ncbi:Uncharacterised protein [Rodentibacter pneumotropicus]|uniref:Uncharacterized protein n=1 Tax=Rodentibacter pneumotropicus TaxID=758 RepID=A0A3S4TTB2_9PAST|nr:Uncharacterised protein [Rodentibacter pneumotropicus]